jgi:hypothetical protein
VVGCALGALTDLLWDSFTHEGRWGERHVPWLSEQEGALPGYLWAQCVSSVLGGVVLAAWVVRWWRTTPHAPTDRHVPASALVALAVATVVGAVTGALGARTVDGARTCTRRSSSRSSVAARPPGSRCWSGPR